MPHRNRNDDPAYSLPRDGFPFSSEVEQWAERVYSIIRGRCLLEDEAYRCIEQSWPKGNDGEGDSFSRVQWDEAIRYLVEKKQVHCKPAVYRKPAGDPVQCERCGSAGSLRVGECVRCQGPCWTCEACITMGRSRSCERIIYGTPPDPIAGLPSKIGVWRGMLNRLRSLYWRNSFNKKKASLPVTAPVSILTADDRDLSSWKLSPPQQKAVKEMLSFLQQPADRQFLLWAVCGAGKTEVLFPAIQWAIRQGEDSASEYNVLVATPRKDVVLELEPRLKQAFPGVDWAVLHGASEDRWKRSSCTLATTHQALRFVRQFDLIVVDEVDAYPFHQNAMLYYAIQRALRAGGKIVYLTATPSHEMQRDVKKGILPCTRVAERYHGHPLPLPQICIVKSLHNHMTKGTPDPLLNPIFNRTILRDAQLFIFVPAIKDVERVRKYIVRHGWFDSSHVEGTHSKDAARIEKVRAFRERRIRVLITTTILERGVTVPRSDVLVWGADSPTFGTSALVQMAGRVGRSKDDPVGNVTFLCSRRARDPVLAIRHIEEMNLYARRQKRHG
jgi:competence protein ComFA